MMNLIAKIIATVFGVGYFPVGPGTAGTVVGMVLAVFTQHSLPLYTGVLAGLLVIGVLSSDHLARTLKQSDPGCVVIDEVVGIMIALWGLPLIWPVMISGFFLFRALDMFKIYPINKFEAIPGGIGIVLDDVMAGLYANVILHIALRWANLI